MTASVQSGDSGSVAVTLQHPIAMEEALRLTIRGGGKTVGADVVTEIVA
ncbi:hypothetical protein [Streptomyces sp. NPDC053755]